MEAATYFCIIMWVLTGNSPIAEFSHPRTLFIPWLSAATAVYCRTHTSCQKKMGLALNSKELAQSRRSEYLNKNIKKTKRIK